MQTPLRLITAGICDLLKTDKDSFLYKLSLLLQAKPEILTYLYSNILPINDNVYSSIEEYIKKIIASPEEFIAITDIAITFNYSTEQEYSVHYKVYKYFSTDGKPYGGNAVHDEEHPIKKSCEDFITIAPDKLEYDS